MNAGIFIGGPLDGQRVPAAALDKTSWRAVLPEGENYSEMQYTRREFVRSAAAYSWGESYFFFVAPEVADSDCAFAMSAWLVEKMGQPTQPL